MWCRRTDELVDGPNASHITPMALDRWEARLEDIFRGRPFDMLDAALADTVSRFPVDIQVRPLWQYLFVLAASFDLLIVFWKRDSVYKLLCLLMTSFLY